MNFPEGWDSGAPSSDAIGAIVERFLSPEPLDFDFLGFLLLLGFEPFLAWPHNSRLYVNAFCWVKFRASARFLSVPNASFVLLCPDPKAFMVYP